MGAKKIWFRDMSWRRYLQYRYCATTQTCRADTLRKRLFSLPTLSWPSPGSLFICMFILYNCVKVSLPTSYLATRLCRLLYPPWAMFRFTAGSGAGGRTASPAIRTTIIRTMTTLGRRTPSSLPRIPSWTLVRSGQSGGWRWRSLTNRIMWRLSRSGTIHFYWLNSIRWMIEADA